MKTVRTEIAYSENAGRLEILVRIIYSVALHLVSVFLMSAILPPLTAVHAVHILVLGRRNRTLDRLARMIIFYGSRANYYTFLLTDERPALIPELD